MWQTPNQRVRALTNSRKREKERLKNAIHIKRINVELEVLPTENLDGSVPAAVPHEKIIVRLILNDLSIKGAGFFSQTAMIEGQELMIVAHDPIKLEVHGRVVWSQEYNAGSHIISNQPFQYRAGIEFKPKNAAEQQMVQAFCDEVVKSHIFHFRR